MNKQQKVKAKNGKYYTMRDMKDWYIQIRSFRSVLCFGSGKNKVCGEGQFGGRYVSEIAKDVENKFIDKYGEDKYLQKIDKLVKEHDKR